MTDSATLCRSDATHVREWVDVNRGGPCYVCTQQWRRPAMRADATWCCYCELTGLFALRQDATVSRPQLVGVDRASGEAENVVDVQRRPRGVGRVAALPVGQAVRGGEVRVRTVDQCLFVSAQREVDTEERVRALLEGEAVVARLVGRVGGDPEGLAGHATRLQGHVLAGDRGRGNARAQTGLHTVRGVHELVSKVVALAGAGAGGRGPERGAAAVLQVHLRRDQAERVELGHKALAVDGEVLSRVAVAGAEQDDRGAGHVALLEGV